MIIKEINKRIEDIQEKINQIKQSPQYLKEITDFDNKLSTLIIEFYYKKGERPSFLVIGNTEYILLCSLFENLRFSLLIEDKYMGMSIIHLDIDEPTLLVG